MTELPLVSVVVPVWNGEDTLRQTLESVALQTHRSLEIIIVDDGSTDGTAAVAAAFCASEPRARLISKENGGVASARNTGILDSLGEWIALIDSDDLWHPTKIEKQLKVALATPEPLAFVYCWYRVIDRHGYVLGSGPARSLSGRAVAQLAYFNVVRNGSALLVSRNRLLQVGGYDEALVAASAQGCEDVMVQLRLALDGGVGVVPEYLVAWRQTGSNMSRDFLQLFRSHRLVFERLNAPSRVPGDVARWVEARHAFEVALEHGLAGNHLETARFVLRSLRLDPIRGTVLLANYLLRALHRRLRQPKEKVRPRFGEVDPTAASAADGYDDNILNRCVALIDRRRLRQLAALDQRTTG